MEKPIKGAGKLLAETRVLRTVAFRPWPVCAGPRGHQRAASGGRGVPGEELRNFQKLCVRAVA